MALIRTVFTHIDPAIIAQVATQQLLDYNYTFPTLSNISTSFFCSSWLISIQSNRASLNRNKPYRNIHIITVIWELFFSGGTTSFAHRYHPRFPTFQDSNGDVVLEVPIPMVALVATAVSFILILLLCTNTKH